MTIHAGLDDMSKAIAATAARVGETPVIKNWLLDEEFLEKLKELYGPDYDWAVNTMSHESSGIANAHNTGTQDNPEDSRGLMQINWNFWGSEPNFREEFKDLIQTEEALFDPIINAMAGKYILATEGKSPWAGTREKVEQSLAKDDGFSLISPASAADVRDEDVPEIVTKFTRVEGEPAKEETTVKGKLSGDFDPSQWIVPSTAAAEEPKISMLSDFDPEEWVTQPEELTSEVQQTSLVEDARLAGITGPEMDLSAGAEVWPEEESPYMGDITRRRIMDRSFPPPPQYTPSQAFEAEENLFRDQPLKQFDPRMGVGPSGPYTQDPRMAFGPSGPVEYPDQRGWFQKAKDYTAGVGEDIASYIGDTQAVTSARERIDPNIERAKGFVREAAEPYKVLGQNIAEGAGAGLDFLGITEPDEVPYQQLLDRFDVPGTPWFENQSVGQAIKSGLQYAFTEDKPAQRRFVDNILGLYPEFVSYVINQVLPEGTTIELPLTREKLKDLPDWTVSDLLNAMGRGIENVWGVGVDVAGEVAKAVPPKLQEIEQKAIDAGWGLRPEERAALKAGQAYPSQDYETSLMGDLQREILPQVESLGGDTVDQFKDWLGETATDAREAVGGVVTRVREDPSGAVEDFKDFIGTGYTTAKDLVGAGLDFIGGDEEVVPVAEPTQEPSTVTITDKGLTSNTFVTSARGGTKGVTDGAVDVQGRPIYTTADPQTGLDLDIEKEFLDINSTANWLTGLARLIGASDPGPNYRRQRTEQLRLTYEMQRYLLGVGVGTQEIYKLDSDGDIIPGQTPTHWSKNKRVPTGYTTRKPESTQQSRASNAMKKELIASLKKGETPTMAAGKAFNKYRMRISAGGGLAGLGADDAVVYREILSLIRDFGDMNDIPEWKNITLQKLAPNLGRMPGS